MVVRRKKEEICFGKVKRDREKREVWGVFEEVFFFRGFLKLV